MSFKRLFFSCASLAVALTAAPVARAQSCKTTMECHQGFVCIVSTGPAPTTPSCPPDALCPAAGSAPDAKLVAPSDGWCQPASCAADVECGPNMVCHTETLSACSGGASIACAPNTICAQPKPAEPVCTETKVSKCAFRWQLPCSTDTDCGAGFNCMPTVSGTCSGGSGTDTPGGTGTAPTAGGGTTPSSGATAPKVAVPLPPDNCTTTTTFPGWCQPKVTTCMATTDCPNDWTCMTTPSARDGGPAISGTGSAGTSGTATGTTSGGTAGAADVPATSGVPAPADVAPPSMICASVYGGSVGVARDAKGTPTSGGGTSGTSGSSVPKPEVSTGPGGTAPPAETAGSSANAGCAVAGDGRSPLGLLALGLAVVLMARRRR